MDEPSPADQFLSTLKVLASTVRALPGDPSDAPRRRRTLSESEAFLFGKGLDPEAFIRYGLGRDLARVMAVWIMLISRPEASTFREVLTDHGANLLRWVALTGHIPEDLSGPEDPLPQDELERIVAIVYRWVLSAPYDDLLEWAPPTAEDLRKMPGLGKATAAVCESYVWLSDRFLNDELNSWERASLVNEYKWLKSQIPNPCPESLMQLVSHDMAAVSEQLAHLYVFGQNDGERRLLVDIQRQSVDLLQQSRFVEAAMLFEFYSRRHPEDPVSINNRGFCTLPVDPLMAQSLLCEARRKGYASLAINTYNQMLCLRRTAREGEALDLAEDYWQRNLDAGPVDGVIWNHASEEHELIQATDVREFLVALAAEICDAMGMDSRSAVWGDRLESLTSGNQKTLAATD